MTEVKKTRRVVRHKKKIEIDTDWVQSKTEVGRAVHWCFYLVWGFCSDETHTHTIGELSELIYNVNKIKNNVLNVERHT